MVRVVEFVLISFLAADMGDIPLLVVRAACEVRTRLRPALNARINIECQHLMRAKKNGAALR